MTILEFDKQAWGYGIRAKYKGDIYPIVSVDFGEKLVQLSGVVGGWEDEEESYAWVRCENISVHNVIGMARRGRA